MKQYAETFYKGRAWKNAQRLAMQRDNFLCVECRKRGDLVPAVLVHHIQPITPANINDPAITLNLANLESLCADCHAAIHASESRNQRRRYVVLPDGSIAPR